jgi:hypothetical protein
MSNDLEAEASNLKLALAKLQLKEVAAEVGLRPDAVSHIAERIVSGLRLGQSGLLESYAGHTVKSVVTDLQALNEVPYAFVRSTTASQSQCAFTREQLRKMSPRERLSAINGEISPSPTRKAPN